MSYQIIVGVDGSDNAQRALRWAIDEAELRQGQVTALFAWQYPLIGVPGAFDQGELEAEAKAFLGSEVAAVTGGDQAPVTMVVAQGDPSASLLIACEQVSADLLVLGSRGREGFSGLLLGSVGQECAVHSRCPVVIVKPDLVATDAGSGGNRRRIWWQPTPDLVATDAGSGGNRRRIWWQPTPDLVATDAGSGGNRRRIWWQPTPDLVATHAGSGGNPRLIR